MFVRWEIIVNPNNHIGPYIKSFNSGLYIPNVINDMHAVTSRQCQPKKPMAAIENGFEFSKYSSGISTAIKAKKPPRVAQYDIIETFLKITAKRHSIAVWEQV